MSEGERIESLKAKHAELETKLDTEKRKLQPDAAAVTEIKKRKLFVKDEMERLDHARGSLRSQKKARPGMNRRRALFLRCRTVAAMLPGYPARA